MYHLMIILLTIGIGDPLHHWLYKTGWRCKKGEFLLCPSEVCLILSNHLFYSNQSNSCIENYAFFPQKNKNL